MISLKIKMSINLIFKVFFFGIFGSALSCVSWRSGYCTITIQSRLLPRIMKEIPLNVSSIRSSLPSAQAKSSYMWGESRRLAGFTEPMSDRSLASCIKHLPDLTDCCTYPLIISDSTLFGPPRTFQHSQSQVVPFRTGVTGGRGCDNLTCRGATPS